MALSYLFQFLDKSAIGFTAILGLREDLHLSGEDFSWASGIYYFGYLIASYPAGVLMVRWRVGKTIAAAVQVPIDDPTRTAWLALLTCSRHVAFCGAWFSC